MTIRDLKETAQEWEDLKRQGRDEEAARILAKRDEAIMARGEELAPPLAEVEAAPAVKERALRAAERNGRIVSNSASEAANGYLKVSADYAEREDWLGAGANAAEAAKYFGIADKLAEQEQRAEEATG